MEYKSKKKADLLQDSASLITIYFSNRRSY